VAPFDPPESVVPDQTAPSLGERVPAGGRGRYRRALRYRDLRLLIVAFVIDQVGTWSYAVVISVYVFDRTHSAQWLAVAAICRWGPALLLASYGGVLADRYQRTTVMIVSGLISAVLMTAMAVVMAAGAAVGWVLAISALSAAVLAPYRPAAGALTPEIVGAGDLAAANSIFSGLENLVIVVGPGIGGLLLLTGPPFIGVAVNAASFAVAAAVVGRLRVQSQGGGNANGNAVRQWVTGVRALAERPVAIAVMLFCALDGAVYGASAVLFVPLSIRLGTGPDGYAYLLAGGSLGGVIGAGLAGRLSETSRLAPVMMGGLAVQALPFLATVPVHSPALAGALQVVSGTGMVVVDVLAITTLQRDLPGRVLSRVLGVFDTLVLAGVLLAGLATGILLDHAQVTAGLVAVGAGIPVLALIGLPALLRADRTSADAARQLRSRVGLLAGLDLLAAADHVTLEQLAAAAEELVVPADHVIIREGETADALVDPGPG
jgi:MFS family permease